jgi:hypothetical protein
MNEIDKITTNTDEFVNELTILIIRYALEKGLSVQWIFHRIQESTFNKTTKLNYDIDFLLAKGSQTADEWYAFKIEEYTRKKKVFGIQKEE